MTSGNVSLRCTKNKCSTRIKMDKSMTAIVHVNGVHLLDIVNDHVAQYHVLRNNCKRKTVENITDEPSKIIRHELCTAENTEMVSDDIGNIQVSIYQDVNYY